MQCSELNNYSDQNTIGWHFLTSCMYFLKHVFISGWLHDQKVQYTYNAIIQCFPKGHKKRKLKQKRLAAFYERKEASIRNIWHHSFTVIGVHYGCSSSIAVSGCQKEISEPSSISNRVIKITLAQSLFWERCDSINYPFLQLCAYIAYLAEHSLLEVVDSLEDGSFWIKILREEWYQVCLL